MLISLADSRINGFKKWSNDHPPSSNDDDIPGGATPVGLEKLSADPEPPADPSSRPWAIPGVGGAF